MKNYNSLVEDGKYKFSSDYGTALLVVMPLIILIAVEYALGNWFNVNQLSTMYLIIFFIIGTLVGFITLKLTVQFVKNFPIDFDEVLRSPGAIIQYFIYAVIIWAIQWVLTQWGGTLSLDIVYKIVEPFSRFILGAMSPFGFALRFMIVFDILIIIYTIIIGFVIGKFVMVPYAIADNENVVEAFRISWEDSEGYLWEIVKVFLSIMIKVLIVINIYFFFVFNMSAPALVNFFTYVFLFILILWILPLSYTMLGTVYARLRR